MPRAELPGVRLSRAEYTASPAASTTAPVSSLRGIMPMFICHRCHVERVAACYTFFCPLMEFAASSYRRDIEFTITLLLIYVYRYRGALR